MVEQSRGCLVITFSFQHYFGDSNLPGDKFLQSAAAENEGGCILISLLQNLQLKVKGLGLPGALV